MGYRIFSFRKGALCFWISPKRAAIPSISSSGIYVHTYESINMLKVFIYSLFLCYYPENFAIYLNHIKSYPFQIFGQILRLYKYEACYLVSMLNLKLFPSSKTIIKIISVPTWTGVYLSLLHTRVRLYNHTSII